MDTEQRKLSNGTYILPVLLLLALVVCALSAGCVSQERVVELPPSDILQTTADGFSEAILFKVGTADDLLAAFAGNLAASSLPPEDLLREFYIDNIKLQSAGYYDARNNITYTAPLEAEAIDLRHIYETADFTDEQTILCGPFFTADHGTLYAFVHPVYANGNYSGIAASLFDPVVFVTDAAVDYGGLDGLGVKIIRTDGILFYTPFASDIGRDCYEYSDKWSSVSVIGDILENESGLSGIYASYTPGLRSEHIYKQAAWKTITFLGADYRLVVTSCEELPELPENYLPEYKDMQKSVRDVYIYAYTYGKEATLKALNDPNGIFAHEYFDIFAFDTNGTLLASQKRPYQVGYSLINWRSAYGIRAIESMADISQTSGGGWYYFTTAVSEDPTEQYGVLSASYIMLMDSDWFIASIIPAQAERVSVHTDVKNSLLPTMQAALRMYLEDGDAALEKYQTREGTPLEGDTHPIFVFDRNGTIISSSAHPNLAGKDALYLTFPSTGVSLTRMLIMKAESGGGFTTIDTYNSETGEDIISVVYIEPLNNHSFILAAQKIGAYVSQDELQFRGES